MCIYLPTLNPDTGFGYCYRRGAAFKILLVITISLLTSCCSFGLPWFVKCRACPTNLTVECPTADASGNFKSFQCPAGYYNDLASLFLNTNDDAIRNLFSTSTEKEFRISSLFVFLLLSIALALSLMALQSLLAYSSQSY